MGTKPNTVFPEPQPSGYTIGPNISLGLRSWINWNIPVKISLTAGWEDFLKIQRDDSNASYVLEHILGIIAPEASILVQNAPKSLAAGAPPQTPLGELTALPQTP